MRDPGLIDAARPRIPDEWRRHYALRPLEQLRTDVTHAFDRIWTLEREKDQLRKELATSQNRARASTILIRFLLAAAMVQGAILCELVRLL